MSVEQNRKEQRRLMSDSSHSGEDSENAALYKDSHEEEGGGICGTIIKSKTARLVSMLVLIVGYFFAEIIVGNLTNSLTLVADSFHMLSDALSLIVGLVAVRMSRRTARDPFRPWPSKEPYFNTFGWVRFEVLGALINSTFLLALCISITLEAIEKFTDPKLVDDPKLVLAVGGGGLIVNIIGLVMFGSHSHGHSHGDESKKDKTENTNGDVVNVEEGGSPQKKAVQHEHHMNMRAVFLHVLGDALGSVIVMISATVIWLVPPENNSWTQYMDPSMSVLLVCIMVFTTVPLFKQSSMILLQTVPKHIKLEKIRNKLQKIAGIQAIHDLHIWQLTGEKIVATVHVQCANAETYLILVQKIRESLHDEGIHSFTVQPEFSFSEDEQAPFCQLVCGESCSSKTCCPPDNPKSEKVRRPSGARLASRVEQASYETSSDAMQILVTSSGEEAPVAEALPNAIPSSTVVVEQDGSDVTNPVPSAGTTQTDSSEVPPVDSSTIAVDIIPNRDEGETDGPVIS